MLHPCLSTPAPTASAALLAAAMRASIDPAFALRLSREFADARRARTTGAAGAARETPACVPQQVSGPGPGATPRRCTTPGCRARSDTTAFADPVTSPYGDTPVCAPCVARFARIRAAPMAGYASCPD